MDDEVAKLATPHQTLIAELLDSNVPKNEREWAAYREIESLRSQLVVTKAFLDVAVKQRDAVCDLNEKLRRLFYLPQ